MGRILAIDYGSKRCGIAVTDPLRIIATALTTVPTADLLSYLKQYTSAEVVDVFVLGLSFHKDGQPTDIQLQINSFKEKLALTFPAIPIHDQDERYTSKQAQESLLQSGLGKKQRQNKSLIDQVSAVLILQGYMARMGI